MHAIDSGVVCAVFSAAVEAAVPMVEPEMIVPDRRPRPPWAWN